MLFRSAYAFGANLYSYPFALAARHRSEGAQAYVSDHYSDFGELRSQGLDALILTGANPTHFELSDEPFWEGLTEVIDWADSGVLSTLCSCLATHAVLEHRGLAKRSKLKDKRWGVYQHGTVAAAHPLLARLAAPVEAPHSHWFDMTADELEGVGLAVLVSGDEAGVHMATSDDGFRYVFFQGHPEYDDISLAKEYKREVARYLADAAAEPPMHVERPTVVTNVVLMGMGEPMHNYRTVWTALRRLTDVDAFGLGGAAHGQRTLAHP